MKVKNTRGITLIALIVTIIVLVLIAGVTIAALTSDNGILRQTNAAKVDQIEGTAREQVKLAISAMKLAIAEASSKDNSYNASENAGKIQLKLKEILNTDKSGLNGEFDFGGNKVTGASLEITISYTGDDYQNACNDVDANILYTITLGQKSIELVKEKTSNLKDQNQNDVEIDIGVGTKLSAIANIGDYVNYDPTTGGNVNSTNTTYTSMPGSITEHGNGYTSLPNGQTFSAVAYKNSGGKWQILDIDEKGRVILLSDIIYRDNEDGTAMLAASNANGLKLFNGIGYLWAEEEMHRIAAAYGHGDGADLSQTVTYYYGGPNDQDGSIPEQNVVELQQGRKTTLKLDTPSGARALTLDDLEAISGDTEHTKEWYNISAEKNLNNSKYYPTLDPQKINNTLEGDSLPDENPNGTYYDTAYRAYISSNHSNLDARYNQVNMLKNEKNYFLASRAISFTDNSRVSFSIPYYSGGATILNVGTFGASDGSYGMYSTISYGVRVLVTLESTTKTGDKVYNSDTGWNIVVD